MINKIEIYTTPDNQTQFEVKFDQETVWLTQDQMAELFDKAKSTINEHIKNIFSEEELISADVMRKFGNSEFSTKPTNFYNLDVIISVGYRVKSKRGTQFRKWATQRLKDYLILGYTVNEKRLAEKNQEVQHLKTGISILSRVLEDKIDAVDHSWLTLFAKGLQLLDDYDHESLDIKGLTHKGTSYPGYDDYLAMIDEMYSDFESDVFAKPKDGSFQSSIGQIKQSFGGEDLYPTIEEKAANLLYFVVKNHSFVDGNKRIAAACFLYFLDKNDMLYKESLPVISNEALASLTLYIAESKPDEAETVKRLIISVLNRSK